MRPTIVAAWEAVAVDKGIRWRQPRGWAGLPTAARVVLAVYAIGFLEGAGSHVLQIAGGGVHTYDWVWWPSQVLYYTLVVWDSLAVYLALRAHPAVVPLGVAIMVLDLGSNWHYNWSAIRADPCLFWSPVGLLPMSSFGLFVAAAGVPLWRVLRGREVGSATPDIW
ncbi:hypothetical protein ABH926_009536 [Catenulispora sp. GP43]|uniref:hypothetical protein n=1 Tax=Catenulispora sp. GP43 TaxID=3156263 RepID=UPI0035192810